MTKEIKVPGTDHPISIDAGKELADAAWTYRAPYPAVNAIAGRVAFYTDRVQVKLETQ